MMEPKVQAAFRKSNATERYMQLSKRYQVAIDEQYEDYEIKRVLEIIDGLGFKATHDTKENFFKIVFREQNYKFQLNISLKYGEVDLIWCVWKEQELIEGSPLGVLVKWDIGSDKHIFRPAFRNDEELGQLLAEAIQMFNDFKAAVLDEYKIEKNEEGFDVYRGFGKN